MAEGRSAPSLLQLARADALSGWQVGEWTLTRLLGKGGMSVVYEAAHADQVQVAAVKLLHPGRLDDEAHLQRLQREAETLYRLQHPHIVDIYEYGWDPRLGFYMVLERLRGQDLGMVFAERHTNNQPLPVSWLLQVVEQISDALQKAHDEGVIHRDLKPANIFLLAGHDEPVVKVLDFGIAKVEHKQDEERLTATGAILGTPSYLAPEQIKSNASTAPMTDIYALGVILYEALTGRLPIDGDAGFEHLLRVVQAVPEPLGVHRPEFEETELEEVIMRMLAKEPQERPSTIDMCWNELSIACQFVDDPLDIPEHYPIIEELCQADLLRPETGEGLSPARPILFATDGQRVHAVSGDLQPSPEGYRRTQDAVRNEALEEALQANTITSTSSQTRASSDIAGPPSSVFPAAPARSLGLRRVLMVVVLLLVGLGAWIGRQLWLPSSKPRPQARRALPSAGAAATKKRTPKRAVPARRPVGRRLVARGSAVLSPEALLQQAKALRFYQKAHDALQAAKKAAAKGKFADAVTRSAQFLAHWKQFRRRDARGLAAQSSLRPARLKGALERWKALKKLQQQIKQLHTRAEFGKVTAVRKTFLARLKKHPQRRRFVQRFAKEAAKERKGKRALQQAKVHYRKRRWRKAYDAYRRFMRLFPKASQRRLIKKRIKACSCALKLRPWEICTKGDYPRNWKGK